jgi:acyl-coenzyme A synthetase/AMP-(fatty) acid ligase
MNYRLLRDIKGAVFMKDLIREYENHEICYADKKCDDAAVIVHTSGTTKGVPKPVPLSDRAVNESSRRSIICGKTSPARGRMISLLFNSLYAGSSFMGMISPLANGGKMCMLPMIKPGLRYLLAIKKYRVNSVVMFSALVDIFTAIPIRPDLSSVQSVMLVGSYASADSIRQCRRFFRECGSKARVFVGYGLTEAGVGLTMSDPDMKDDSVGSLMSGVKARFWDEDEKCFYEPDGKPHTGVLYISTPSLSGGRLDDEIIFELDEIDGDKYLNTNDLFRINEDGVLYYLGRSNRFFINEKGIKFEAGLVERAVSAQKGIKSCGLAPYFNKKIHETEPVLYAETERSDTDRYRIIRNALKQVYITDGLIDKTALPARCVLTDHIPRTANGKVDVKKITEGRVRGTSFRIEGVYENEKLKDIKLIKTTRAESSYSSSDFF